MQVLLRLRVILQQLQVLVEQLHLPLAPFAPKLAHARDLLQQLLLARDPHGQQLLRDDVAQVAFEHHLQHADVAAEPGMQPVAWVRSGIRNRDVSAITPSDISAHPIGTAVCVTFSRTSYAVKRISDSLCSPSHVRNAMVQINWGLELRSITSVRPYLIQPDDRLLDVTCTTTDGFGGLPLPSHSRLSHEMTDSQMGISFKSVTVISRDVCTSCYDYKSTTE
uniref:Uncharacterized protein n=1 Tax=Anopheles melas TaxID=34690 RepID=A0A182TIX7_9DIPT